mmetsp:Transcript_95977/g.298853  ORF Transcript_95977/g.298853 Transcript_95977/m.298853 type:complete len:220 (-) Transcript_95977:487-1146(-)
MPESTPAGRRPGSARKASRAPCARSSRTAPRRRPLHALAVRGPPPARHRALAPGVPPSRRPQRRRADPAQSPPGNGRTDLPEGPFRGEGRGESSRRQVGPRPQEVVCRLDRRLREAVQVAGGVGGRAGAAAPRAVGQGAVALSLSGRAQSRGRGRAPRRAQSVHGRLLQRERARGQQELPCRLGCRRRGTRRSGWAGPAAGGALRAGHPGLHLGVLLGC